MEIYLYQHCMLKSRNKYIKINDKTHIRIAFVGKIIIFKTSILCVYIYMCVYDYTIRKGIYFGVKNHILYLKFINCS